MGTTKKNLFKKEDKSEDRIDETMREEDKSDDFGYPRVLSASPRKEDLSLIDDEEPISGKLGSYEMKSLIS